jgi:ABC-type branched-subunit amino acid transport system substrate-binding protein
MSFHIQPSAAMYLDALAGWYVRAGFRRWYIVKSADNEGSALHERLSWTLENRHFGANEVGTTVLADSTDTGAALRSAIERSRADLLVLLVDAGEQLRIMADLDAAGLTMEVAGYPFPETQSRDFLAASRAAAPNLGTDHRASAWEASIDAYGAREYNARHRLRWESEPQDAAAWAAFHAVKILFEAALFGGSTDGTALAAYFANQSSVFDLHKGIAVTFRPWDHQLRQSLFLVKVSETADNAFDLALLVGELPAIYMPGTDPEERLDQLGDLANRSTCRF